MPSPGLESETRLPNSVLTTVLNQDIIQDIIEGPEEGTDGNAQQIN